MKEDGFREKYDPGKRLSELRKGSEPADAPPPSENAVDGEQGEAYSLLSADRQQKVMVEFRLKDGNAKALAYSFLVAADFNPSTGIGLDFSGYDVRVSGRNLAPLFSALVTQRVAVVSEVDELQAASSQPKDATVVTKIEIDQRG